MPARLTARHRSPPPAVEAPPRDGFLPALDGYRGLAMWMVVAYHMGNVPGFGWVAIQMFFVLSGFLITRMLLVEQHLPLGQGLRLFYWRSALRILPALYAYLLILLALSYLIAELATARGMIGWSGLYLHNIALMFRADQGITAAGVMATQHLWSLCVEEHFYLFWPLLLLLTAPRYRVALALALVLLAPMVRLAMQLNWPGDAEGARPYPAAIYVFSASHLDAFALGALLTLLHRHPALRRVQAHTFVLLCVAAAAAGMLASSDSVLPDTLSQWLRTPFGYPLFMHEGGIAVWGYTVVNLLCAYLLLLSLHHATIQRWLAGRFLRWSGKISYSMYLLHQPILHLFREYRGNVIDLVGIAPLANLLWCALYLALIFGLASLSFRYFESYFIRLKPRHRVTPIARAAQVDRTATAPDAATARAVFAAGGRPQSN